MAEPNGENRVKIRPMETDIKWLTEIVKKERNSKIAVRDWQFYCNRPWICKNYVACTAAAAAAAASAAPGWALTLVLTLTLTRP